MYPDHGDETNWDVNFGFLAEDYPIVVTEWGFSPDVDPEIHFFGSREKFGQRCLRYMEENGMNWIAWCFHPEWGPTMINDWDYTPTQSGLLVRQALTEDASLPAVTVSYPENASVVSGSFSITGTATDDIGLLVVELSIDRGLYLDVSNSFSLSFAMSNWTFLWNTTLLTNGISECRSSSSSGNSMSMLPVQSFHSRRTTAG